MSPTKNQCAIVSESRCVDIYEIPIGNCTQYAILLMSSAKINHIMNLRFVRDLPELQCLGPEKPSLGPEQPLHRPECSPRYLL